MTIQKTAQQNLYKELARSQIVVNQNPVYNDFSIDDFGIFQDTLNKLYENFENELNDNLTNRSPSLEIYLVDIITTLNTTANQIRTFQQEEIYETLNENPEGFKINRLAYMNYFLDFQLGIIGKTQTQLANKLSLVKNVDLFKPTKEVSDAIAIETVFKNKIKSNLARVDLTVLLWWLAETKIIEFDGSHDNFIKFVEDNFQYLDKGKNIYSEMKHIGALMTKLNDPTSTETNVTQSRNDLLETLRKQIGRAHV